MKKFTLGKHHALLQIVAKDLDTTFLEFCLFSETRFMEYSHRIYDHFYTMYPVLITKIRQDLRNGEITEKLLLDREFTEKRMAQATFVLKLAFMREISHLITRFSKSSQKFDVLPFHAMIYYEKIVQKLVLAKNSMKKEKYLRSK